MATNYGFVYILGNAAMPGIYKKIDVHRSFDVLSDPDLSAIQQSARMRELMHSHEEAF